MMAPNLPTSLRLLSTRTIRIALLLVLIAGAATVLSFSSEFASAAVENTTMAVERQGHTATRLADGRVLIAGGDNNSGALNQTELYDPASATFSAAANMGAARVDHSATLLADGRVLIAGGRNGGASLASTEIFDPATGAFTSGPSMNATRAGHTATLLANGSVLIAGGDSGGTAEVYDPAAETFAAAGSLGVARSMHSAALLQDGRVLLVGGRDASGNELVSGEIFDTPASAFWTIGNALKVTRVRAHLRVLFDGKVQIIGGGNDGSMEIYDPMFEGFGAYAHVLPESDPCAGLSGHILNSQTRAALFHNGQADALFDRAGHTITELNGQALVLGGVNSSGAVLSSSAVLGSSSASITTDKMDYAPGEIARISGRGFQPGEVVRVKIHEDPHTPQERGFDITADAEGNFSGEYLVMDYDLDMKFIVGARGLTSGRTAQTTFTDANPQLITVAAPTSVTVIQGATANYGNLTLQVGGNNNSCTVTFSVIPALPAGATAVFGTNPVTTTGANVVTTFSVTTTAATPAGTYTFQVTGTNGGGGCQGPGPTASGTLTLVVNSATVNTTTTVANAIATYGDTSVTLNATITPASGPAVNNGSVTFTVKQGPTTIGAATTDNTVVAGAASVSYALPAGTDAGPYTIEASYTPGTGFNASSGTGTLTINKRAIEVTADAGQFKTYGDADPAAFTYTITSGALVPPDAFTGALSRVAGENAGLYAITIGTLAINDGNGGNNYNLTFVSNNFEIKKRLATWTTNPNSKTYGDPDPVPLTTGSGSNFLIADGVTATYSRVAGENASPPTYHITATLSATPLSALDNYIITNNGAEFTINKRAIEVTADAGQFKIYGDADPATFTYSITSGSLAFTDTFTGALSRVAGENAGLYAITIGTLAINDGNGGNNYNLTFVSNNFEIKKRPATWTTNPNSKTYGDPDPVPLTTGSGSNFLVADGVTATYSRVAGENASPPTYHITATLSATPMSALDNYIITNNGAEFTINKRAIEVTADAGQFKIYGDADPAAFTYSITSGSLAFTDTFTGALSRVAGENAGLYAITIGTLAINDGNGGNNYNLTFVSNNFEIKKRPATWTTNPNSKTYGDPDPVPLTTGSGSNFLVADGVTATYSRVAGENASPPTYHITATLSATPLSALDNYIITNNGAEFTINKRAIEVTADAGQFKTYGDADPAAFTYSITSGSLAFSDAFTGALSRVAGENAGLYAITIGTLAINDGNGGNNYNLTFVSNNFEIKKRAATWTTNPNSKTYGDPDPAPLTTGSGSNFLVADNVTATYSRVAGENASPPTYHITATLSATPLSALDNYIITNNGAEFTINKRAIEVTADAGQFKIYGDADPAAFTYSITSGSLAFTDTFTGALSRVAGENAGLYAITIGTLAINDGNGGNNYNLTFVSNNFEIKKRPATWTTNPNSKTYGDPDPVPLTTGSGSNFLVADGVTATYSRVAGENASPPTYHITATLSATPLSALDNYIITNNGAEFTINKRPIQITATAGQFKTYGDPDPTFAYTITSGTLAFTDTFTGALSRVSGQNIGLYAITIGSLTINDGNGGNNYNLTLVSNNFEIKKRPITVKADPKTKTFGDPDPVFTYQITSGSLAFSDTFTGALTRTPGELVGTYPIKIGTLAINDDNGGNNYTLTFVEDNLTILTACSVFNGFLSPIGGSIENGNGGTFANPVRAFKLNSTIPVKFNAICFGVPLTTGIHTLQAIKYSNATDGDSPIDATPTDAATTGNQFRLTGTEWHFNMNTKALGGNAQGTYLLKATLFDGSVHSVWVSIKK